MGIVKRCKRDRKDYKLRKALRNRQDSSPTHYLSACTYQVHYGRLLTPYTPCSHPLFISLGFPLLLTKKKEKKLPAFWQYPHPGFRIHCLQEYPELHPSAFFKINFSFKHSSNMIKKWMYRWILTHAPSKFSNLNKNKLCGEMGGDRTEVRISK